MGSRAFQHLHVAGRRMWLLGLLLCACDHEQPAVIHLTTGVGAEDHRSFQPKSALAEYTELPGLGAEVRVVLSSQPITCEKYLPLAEDEVLVTLNFSVPTGTKFGPGIYPWQEIKVEDGQAKSENSPGPSLLPLQVLPHVRMGKRSQALPPGGHVELTEVRLDAQGTVRGLLRLEQPGSVGLPATSVLGSFSARWCRITATNAE